MYNYAWLVLFFLIRIGMLYEDMCNIYSICIRLQYLPYIFVWPKIKKM